MHVDLKKQCSHCLGSDFVDDMLKCKMCYSFYHSFCLLPTDEKNDANDWICFPCRADKDGFGFMDGHEYTLKTFQKKADSFKAQWFAGREISDEVIEKEYWKLVEQGDVPCAVEYGSDLDTETYGSGFPTTGLYARNGWNLCNLPKVANSVLKHLTNVSGITVPWFYVGMLFSSFCWHNEDHYCYSINYVHTGASKHWYGVPGLKAPLFEKCLEKKLPGMFRAQPDLLFHMITMVSPQTLQEAGVPVYYTIQKAGEFVITFPQAYHGGFNHGFNAAEAVNFSPADWLSYGLRGMERYREMNRTPVFPHDLLMCSLAEDGCADQEELAWLLAGLRRMCREETARRMNLFKIGLRKGVPWDENTLVDAKIRTSRSDAPPKKKMRSRYNKDASEASSKHAQCVICRHALYLSAIFCESCDSSRKVCLRHFHQLCGCEISAKRILFRHSITDLEEMVNKVSESVQNPKKKTSIGGTTVPGPADLKMILRENKQVLSDIEVSKFQLPRCSSPWDTSEYIKTLEQYFPEAHEKTKVPKLTAEQLTDYLEQATHFIWGDSHASEVRQLMGKMKRVRELAVLLETLKVPKSDRSTNSLKQALSVADVSTLHDCSDLLMEIQNGPLLLSSSHQSGLDRLISIINRGENLQKRISELLQDQSDSDDGDRTSPKSVKEQEKMQVEGEEERELVDLDMLNGLQEECKALPVSIPANHQFERFVRKVQTWISKVEPIIQTERSARGQRVLAMLMDGKPFPRPTQVKLDIAEALLDEGEALGTQVDLVELELLRAVLKRVKAHSDSVSQLLGPFMRLEKKVSDAADTNTSGDELAADDQPGSPSGSTNTNLHDNHGTIKVETQHEVSKGGEEQRCMVEYEALKSVFEADAELPIRTREGAYVSKQMKVIDSWKKSVLPVIDEADKNITAVDTKVVSDVVKSMPKFFKGMPFQQELSDLIATYSWVDLFCQVTRSFEQQAESGSEIDETASTRTVSSQHSPSEATVAVQERPAATKISLPLVMNTPARPSYKLFVRAPRSMFELFLAEGNKLQNLDYPWAKQLKEYIGLLRGHLEKAETVQQKASDAFQVLSSEAPSKPLTLQQLEDLWAVIETSIIYIEHSPAIEAAVREGKEWRSRILSLCPVISNVIDSGASSRKRHKSKRRSRPSSRSPPPAPCVKQESPSPTIDELRALVTKADRLKAYVKQGDAYLLLLQHVANIDEWIAMARKAVLEFDKIPLPTLQVSAWKAKVDSISSTPVETHSSRASSEQVADISELLKGLGLVSKDQTCKIEYDNNSSLALKIFKEALPPGNLQIQLRRVAARAQSHALER